MFIATQAAAGLSYQFQAADEWWILIRC